MMLAFLHAMSIAAGSILNPVASTRIRDGLVERTRSANVAGLLDALRKADRAGQAAADEQAVLVFEPFLVGLDRGPVSFRDGVTAEPDALAHAIGARTWWSFPVWTTTWRYLLRRTRARPGGW
jgi:hypothetical protein